jgi:competence protein CoiA
VAWHPKKLIFEIQCSPISKEEVKQRNANYTSLGYQVVWIFHDQRYNQSRLSAAELLLHNHPHYFSDMNGEGIGKIYDQFSIISQGKRQQRLPLLPIDLSSPQYVPRKRFKIHRLLKPRLNTWPLSFSGDAIHSFSNQTVSEEQQAFLSELNELQNKNFLLINFNYIKSFFRRVIIQPYQSFLKLLLERACR